MVHRGRCEPRASPLVRLVRSSIVGVLYCYEKGFMMASLIHEAASSSETLRPASGMVLALSERDATRCEVCRKPLLDAMQAHRVIARERRRGSLKRFCSEPCRALSRRAPALERRQLRGVRRAVPWPKVARKPSPVLSARLPFERVASSQESRELHRACRTCPGLCRTCPGSPGHVPFGRGLVMSEHAALIVNTRRICVSSRLRTLRASSACAWQAEGVC